MSRSLKDIVSERLNELAENPFKAARDAGLERGFLNDILIGRKVSVTGKNIAKVALALKIDPAELLALMPGPSTVPLVGYVGAGAEAVLYGEGQPKPEPVPAPAGATKDTVAVQIRGRSMGELLDNWLVYYDDRDDAPGDGLIGKLCVVGLEDGRILVKGLTKGGRRGRFTLTSQAEPPIYDVAVQWAAQVKAMMPP